MSPAASTLKSFNFASKKRVYARLPGVLVLFFVASIGMVGDSIAETRSCPSAEQVFRNFQPSSVKSTVPDVPFVTGEGVERKLSDYRGKGIVLNFWATWCPPCVREMPQLDRLAALVRKNGVDVLTISVDRNGLDLVRSFYKKNNLNDLPILLDQKSKLLRAFGVNGLPTTILVNPVGQEVGRVIGAAEWDAAETVDWVRSCLKP